MEEVLVQVGVQIPGMALLSFMFLRLTTLLVTIIMNQQGAKIDRMAEALDRVLNYLSARRDV